MRRLVREGRLLLLAQGEQGGGMGGGGGVAAVPSSAATPTVGAGDAGQGGGEELAQPPEPEKKKKKPKAAPKKPRPSLDPKRVPNPSTIGDLIARIKRLQGRYQREADDQERLIPALAKTLDKDQAGFNKTPKGIAPNVDLSKW